MAAMNELKAVHMPSETHREFRSLVKYRKTLDCRINKMKCTIRAWFVNHGIEIDTGEKAWHSGRERINSFRKPLIECQPDELWKGELDLELTQFDALTVQLESVVKKLEALGKADPSSPVACYQRTVFLRKEFTKIRLLPLPADKGVHVDWVPNLVLLFWAHVVHIGVFVPVYKFGQQSDISSIT
jgi:hypothetical protein